MPYIGAQMYAKFYTLITTALLVGLGGGPLWCSQSVYINSVAEIYAELVGLPPAAILARFFGIFSRCTKHLKCGVISSHRVRQSAGCKTRY
jgi:hypothetical protein